MLAFMGCMATYGQVTTRHLTAGAVSKATGVTEDIPCAGTDVFSEDFENGIPGTWMVIDGDMRAPMPQMLLQMGWQGRVDYRDSSNHVAVSPSWYTNPGVSNDWLITPAVTLGSNPCLSWRAYSQDQYYKEAYEIRVATTPDTAAFLANAAMKSIAEESGDPQTSATSLAAWAGQTVYVAFRQTSDDKFVLALDDVKITNVNAIDIGVHGIQYGTPDPGDTVTVRFQVANYGSDTITTFQALYTLDGGPAKFMSIGAVSIPPNGTLFFNHDSLYVSDSLDQNYALCAWTTLPNAVLDQEIHNDTLCTTLTIGTPVGRPAPFQGAASMAIYPNPCSEEVSLLPLGLARPHKAQVDILDMQGMVHSHRAVDLMPHAAIRLSMEGLAAGMYFLQVTVEGRGAMTEKLIKR